MWLRKSLDFCGSFQDCDGSLEGCCCYPCGPTCTDWPLACTAMCARTVFSLWCAMGSGVFWSLLVHITDLTSAYHTKPPTLKELPFVYPGCLHRWSLWSPHSCLATIKTEGLESAHRSSKSSRWVQSLESQMSSSKSEGR